MQYFLLLSALAAFGAAAFLLLTLQIPSAMLAGIGAVILLGQAYQIAGLKDLLGRNS